MSNKALQGRSLKRVEKELEKFHSNPVEGLHLEVVSQNCWHMHITGAMNTLYAGEQYTLKITFSNDYPMDSPEILFLTPAPVHPHIYTNGHICLNILYEDWSPALTVQSVCISILSMLSSCEEKVVPSDNAMYVAVPRGGPKQSRFAYHDNTV
mmetsp:Transcript_37456/g.38142  ORF Transcript_37456/g.38142 Transcript_37456/m.38142 type:complete len:153 (-) Transcript_37456:86-544(-)